MFRRVVGFFLFLVLTAAAMGAVVATGLAAISGAGRWVIVAVTVLLLVGFALLARRMFRRSWSPIGDLIEATGRLGEGEHGVRLRVSGPRPFVAVGRSFNKMAERLEEEDERRRRFIADIGHELRTPMTVIRGEVEAVLDGLHSPDQLSNVVDEIGVIDRLLDDLRLLSMAESGTLRLETEPTDLGELVRSVVSSFSRRSSAQNVEVATTFHDSCVATVDPHRIYQVVSNLIANALDQMPTGGHLDVEVGDYVRSMVIVVTDSGPGIAPEDLDRVFDRFVRSSDSKGTGLGLSISRDLVEAHGGTITAANRADEGAIFTVNFPHHTGPPL